MPHHHVALQAAAREAAVGGAPHKAVHALGVVAARVRDALPARVGGMQGAGGSHWWGQ
jgi:hypothetical protein